MSADTKKLATFLEGIASDLDIPPSKFQQAVSRYEAVGNWLQAGEEIAASGVPDICVQGSFRLGTVVRPIRGGAEADYDIDLVCEVRLAKGLTNPHDVKAMVGDRLKENATYKRMLAPEGRRCWTIEYAEQDDIGFHIDVLPAVHDDKATSDTAIAITNRAGSTYSWSSSDPRGYGRWFDAKNAGAFRRVLLEEKARIRRREPMLFENVDQVPDRLVRTPLQRAVQLMKRHRDTQFCGSTHLPYAPISIIITTLAAHLYADETDVYSALTGIVGKLRAHAPLIENRAIPPHLAATGLITRLPDGRWYIGNPVNPNENFADRWHEDKDARARTFFAWVDALQRDVLDVLGGGDTDLLREHLGSALGVGPVTKNLNLLLSPIHTPSAAPRIHIAAAAKPWRVE